MIDRFSIKKAAHFYHISTHTAFIWRHKVLDALVAFTKEPKLSGMIQADETFFSLSFKGTRQMPFGYYAKKRGTSFFKTPPY